RQIRSMPSPHPDFSPPDVSQCPLQRGEAAVAEQRQSGTEEPTQDQRGVVVTLGLSTVTLVFILFTVLCVEDRRTERDSGPAHRGSRPMSSPHRDVRGVLFAAPPPPVLGSVPLVQFVPVCPPVLYYSSPVINVAPSHPQPIYVSLGGGVATGVRGHHEQVRGGAGRSLSADQRSLSSSLNHAIEAARGMRESSRRMARSIATGLHHQEA
ncbi:unnamed protein product, partial [Coregonus sp. 'balchen']